MLLFYIFPSCLCYNIYKRLAFITILHNQKFLYLPKYFSFLILLIVHVFPCFHLGWIWKLSFSFSWSSVILAINSFKYYLPGFIFICLQFLRKFLSVVSIILRWHFFFSLHFKDALLLFAGFYSFCWKSSLQSLLLLWCVFFFWLLSKLWETWVSKIRMLVVNFCLGKDVQLNCSALLNEKDVLYWNIWENNGKDPNVHEEEERKIRYVDVIHDIYHDM